MSILLQQIAATALFCAGVVGFFWAGGQLELMRRERLYDKINHVTLTKRRK